MHNRSIIILLVIVCETVAIIVHLALVVPPRYLEGHVPESIPDARPDLLAVHSSGTIAADY